MQRVGLMRTVHTAVYPRNALELAKPALNMRGVGRDVVHAMEVAQAVL